MRQRSYKLPRTCTICSHHRRLEIDRCIVAGETFRNIAKRVSLSAAALFRHSRHLPIDLGKAHEAEQVAHADGLLGQLKQLTSDARRIQEKAERAEDYRAALAGVRELIRIIDLVARLSGELQERNETNILNIHIDPQTATRMAEIYLARRKALEVVPRWHPLPGLAAESLPPIWWLWPALISPVTAWLSGRHSSLQLTTGSSWRNWKPSSEARFTG